MLNTINEIVKMQGACSKLERALLAMKEAEDVLSDLGFERGSVRRSLLWTQMPGKPEIDVIETCETNIADVVENIQSVMYGGSHEVLVPIPDKSLWIETGEILSQDIYSELGTLLRKIVDTAPLQNLQQHIADMVVRHDNSFRMSEGNGDGLDWHVFATTSTLKKEVESRLTLEYLQNLGDVNFTEFYWLLCNEGFRRPHFYKKIEWLHDLYFDLGDDKTVAYLKDLLSSYISVVLLHRSIFAT